MNTPDQFYISPRATVDRNSLQIGNGSSIQEGASILSNVTIGSNVLIGRRTLIASNSYIGNNVCVGNGVDIGHHALILARAKICPDEVKTHSTNARDILPGVSIGEKVLLHNEVELGEYAIVPTQRTIAALGNFGDNNRVVTIYGSDEGPRFSVGCQLGITFATLRNRVAISASTVSESANTYAPFLPVFSEIGRVVQLAYDGEANLVEEMKDMRQELLPKAGQQSTAIA